jgi:DNA-binding transcriptional MerR regulator
MYRIGDFSIISRVSIKMLRHYDEIGLFVPAQIDRFTRYRYYTLDQLPRLNRIMALKEMGFSLAEVAHLLDSPLSAEDMSRMLAEKQAALAAQMAQLEDQLMQLATWMKRIEIEGKMPDYVVTLKPFTLELPSLPDVPGETPITRPFPGVAGLDRDIVFRADALPIPDALACVVHQGDTATLTQAYLALDAWITDNGYEIAGSPREIALQAEADQPGLIEVQLPIQKTKRREA